MFFPEENINTREWGLSIKTGVWAATNQALLLLEKRGPIPYHQGEFMSAS
jgi:hypothetical protein